MEATPKSAISLSQRVEELLDPKPGVRKKAAKALEALVTASPEGQSLQTLIDAALRLRLRARADKALAITDLGLLGHREAIPAILATVERANDHQVLLDALFPALHQLQPKGDLPTITWLVQLLLRTEADNTHARKQITDLLAQCEGQPHAIALCLETLERAERFHDMAQAIWLLGAYQEVRLLPYARRFLQQSTTRDLLCTASYEAICALENDEAITTLQELLQEDIAQPVALGIAATLCKMGCDHGAALLVQELQPDNQRRTPPALSMEGLSYLPTNAYNTLFLRFLERAENSHHARLAALVALGRKQAQDTIPILTAILEDGSEYYSIHNAVAVALAQIAPATPNPTRDNRLRNLLTLDLEARQDNSLDVSHMLVALSGIALAASQQLEELQQGSPEADAYIAALRQRNKQMIPTLFEYKRCTHQQPRFVERRGPDFLGFVDDCVAAWQTLNEQLNQLAIGHHSEADPAAFSELRAQLALAPTFRHWESICKTLDTWPIGDDLLVALRYADQHLDAWPDQLRWLPPRWQAALHSQQYEPRIMIARQLGLGDMQLTQQALLPLLHALPSDHPFTILDLQRNVFASAFAKALSEIPSLARFRELDLYYNNIGAKGLAYLLESPYCRQLRRLNVRSNNLGNKGAILLAKAQGWDQLEELNLCSNRISRDGGEALAESHAFPALQKLDLTTNNIPPETMDTLRNAPQFKDVQILLDG